MSIYRWAMRVGSPILFWLSLLIVVASIMNVYDTAQDLYSQGLELDGLKTITRFKVILTAVGQSLLLGALPFSAALIIDRFDRFLTAKEVSQ